MQCQMTVDASMQYDVNVEYAAIQRLGTLHRSRTNGFATEVVRSLFRRRL